MGKTIDHVGIVVKDIEKALAKFIALGLQPGPAGIGEVPTEGVKIVLLTIPGTSQSVELIQPVKPGCVTAQFLEKHGEGLYSVAWVVDDIEAEVKALRAGGLSVEKVKSLPEYDTKYTFVKPESLTGARFEFVEHGPKWKGR